MAVTQAAGMEFRAVGGHFGDLVHGVPEGRWDAAAPVAGWTARDVVRHLVEWLPDFLAGGCGITLPAGPSVDDDPVAAWDSFAASVQDLLDDPATASRVLTNRHVGEVPLPDAVSRFFTADVFLHSWDLARATGQDDTLDPVRCQAMLDAMTPIEDLMRSSGQYGPRVPIDDDAPVQDRLMAFIGRDPDWTAPRGG